MRREKIDNRIEESAISTAVAEMMDIEGEKLWNEYQKTCGTDTVCPDEKHKAEFEAALNKAYSIHRMVTFFKRLAKPAKYVVTSLAVLIIAFSVSVISVDALRIKFIDWLTRLNDTHMTVDKVDQTAVNYNDILKTISTSFIKPPDYTFKSTISEYEGVTTTFEDTENHYIVIMQLCNNQTSNVDNEEQIESEDVLINGNDGIFIKKNNNMKIIWNIDDSTFVVFTNDDSISKEEFIEIAESVR